MKISRKTENPKRASMTIYARIDTHRVRMTTEITDERDNPGALLYDTSIQFALYGVVLSPKQFENRQIQLYCRERNERHPLTLSDVQARGPTGERLHREKKGEYMPVYNFPDGIAQIHCSPTKKESGWWWIRSLIIANHPEDMFYGDGHGSGGSASD